MKSRFRKETIELNKYRVNCPLCNKNIKDEIHYHSCVHQKYYETYRHNIVVRALIKGIRKSKHPDIVCQKNNNRPLDRSIPDISFILGGKQSRNGSEDSYFTEKCTKYAG